MNLVIWLPNQLFFLNKSSNIDPFLNIFILASIFIIRYKFLYIKLFFCFIRCSFHSNWKLTLFNKPKWFNFVFFFGGRPFAYRKNISMEGILCSNVAFCFKSYSSLLTKPQQTLVHALTIVINISNSTYQWYVQVVRLSLSKITEIESVLFKFGTIIHI